MCALVRSLAASRVANSSGSLSHARALVREPPLVLADEPTGNLDTVTADEVFAMMRRLNEERGTAFVVVTHDPRIASKCARVVELVDGRIVADGSPASPPPAR